MAIDTLTPLTYSRNAWTLLSGSISAEMADPIAGGNPLMPFTANALQLDRAGDWDAALAQLETLGPGDWSGHFTRAILLARAGRYAEAAESLRQANRIDSTHPVANYNLGLCLLRAAEAGEVADPPPTPGEAAAAFRRHLGIRPDHREARLGLIGALMAGGILHEAYAEIKRLLQATPDDPDGLRLLTRYLLLTGRRDEAIALWEMRQMRAPGQEDPLLQLLWLALEAEDRPAIEDYRRALAELQRKSLLASKLLAAAALTLADHESAFGLLQMIATQEPSLESWHNLGYAAHYLGDLVTAEMAYREAVALEPDAPEPKINLAAVLDAKGDTAAALSLLSEQADWADWEVIAPWNLALLCEQQGDFARAEALYGEVTQIYADWPEAWFRRGLAALRGGARPEGSVRAAGYFRQALELRHHWAEAQAALALAEYEAGGAEAAEQARIALTLQPPSGWTAALESMAAQGR